MGAVYSSSYSFSTLSLSLIHNQTHATPATLLKSQKSESNLPAKFSTPSNFSRTYSLPVFAMSSNPSSSIISAAKSSDGSLVNPSFNPHGVEPELLQKMVYDALVWSSLHGLVVGDRSIQGSGTVPGVGLVHAPFALLPISFPENQWRQACDVAPIFNELIDRVSLDGKFLQDSLSRTKKADVFTSRLLDIHSKMLASNKKEEIRMGLHRSDYMLDEQTKLLLQIELNTISSSFAGLSSLVTELHRSLLSQYHQWLGLDPERIPKNNALTGFADALAKAWTEYNSPRAVVMIVVQAEERNMYDQHWISTVLKEKHNITTVRKTLAEIHEQAELLPDGTLLVDGETVAVVYFRAGYAPADYHSESEWSARELMEKSRAIKCPSISYHLAGTKKIQQEIAKPNMLERFLENKDDIAKLRKCFAGLWSLDEKSIVDDAIERPQVYVMKPQREGGGNNIYGDDVKKMLLKLQKEGNEEDASYILMQRIFPSISPTILMRNGIYHKELTVSELGIYGAYLRNKEKVIINSECGYLMRTKVSSSDEGGVAAGFAVLDSVYLS
jgi:glutathione synthase